MTAYIVVQQRFIDQARHRLHQTRCSSRIWTSPAADEKVCNYREG